MTASPARRCAGRTLRSRRWWAVSIDVQRIPRGVDVRDPLGRLERTAITDVFREISSTRTSAPIASGGLRASVTSYGAVDLATVCASDGAQTDMALAMNDGKLLVRNGRPQVLGGTQFGLDALPLHDLNFATLLDGQTASKSRSA